MNIKASVTTPATQVQSSASGGEAPFRLNEIIYSRSDPRGVVLFGNPTFTRISEYEWSELDGAPHRVLRNPDMPKGVFWLFWNRLKQGLPVGAYVKNKTKTGRFYWVFALVHPCDGGFMSVRFKPTTETLGQVQQLYAQLLQHEGKDARSPEDSAQALLEALADMGLPSYDRFMARALSDEMQTRDAQLGRISTARRDEIAQIVTLANEAESLLGKMSTGFQNIRAEPVNMRILSNRLEGGGGPISSIAQNYEAMAKEMGDDLAQLDHGEIGVFDAIRSASVTGHFAVLAADLAEEAVRELSQALNSGDRDRKQCDTEIRALTTHAESLRELADAEIRIISDRSGKLIDSCRSLRRRVNGLDVVKLMCRVESGRLESFDASLLGIIDRLDRFHGDIDACLAEVARLAQRIHRNARNFL
ncbi:MAG: hypothetical protein HRU31_11400 [Rhodobacteraceae bacterium]|nr:hypothetical protein [Paracoccaceae bacterium]